MLLSGSRGESARAGATRRNKKPRINDPGPQVRIRNTCPRYGCVVLVDVVVVVVDVLGAMLVSVEVDGAMLVSVLGEDIEVSDVVVSVVDVDV